MLSVSLWNPSGMCGKACCSAGLLIEICGISENRLSCHCWHHCSHASHPRKTEREREEEKQMQPTEEVSLFRRTLLALSAPSECFWLRTSQHAARHSVTPPYFIFTTQQRIQTYLSLAMTNKSCICIRKLLFSMHWRFFISTVAIVQNCTLFIQLQILFGNFFLYVSNRTGINV